MRSISVCIITRTTMRNAPGTAISCAHMSGTAPKPSCLAAAAGKSLTMSGVHVKNTEMTSQVAELVVLEHGLDEFLRALVKVLSLITFERCCAP